jgi:putative lipoprotein
MRRTFAAIALSLSAASVSAQPVVTGEAFWRERIATPPGAVFEAVLADVSRADAPEVELGRARIEPAGNPPIRFEIPYDPARIEPAARITVRASVMVDGRLWMTTDTFAPVLTGGAGDRVELMLRMVAAPEAAPVTPARLIGPRWRLLGVGEFAAEADTPAHLMFDADGRLSGSAGCNRIMGGYIARMDGAFLAGDLASTMMACPPPLMDLEQSLFGALQAVREWRIEGTTLELRAEGAPLATFTAETP